MPQPYPYVWHYYPQQLHPYFQFPSNPQITADSGSQQGGLHKSPSVLRHFLPFSTATPLVAEPFTPAVYQPSLFHPNYPHFDPAYNPMQVVAPPAAPYVTHSPGWAPWPRELQRPLLHNLINGGIFTNRLYIDFTKADLKFRIWHNSGDYRLVTLSAYDLEQPATNPPIPYVQILCDAIPLWHVDLYVNHASLLPHRRKRSALPHLTLEDVVCAVHASLHRQISHKEWNSLSASQKIDVTHAYTRRYEASGSDKMMLTQQSEGVKYVDFLLKSTWFNGFTWLEPVNGVERLKLHLRQNQ